MLETDEDLDQTQDTESTPLGNSEEPSMNKEIFAIWTGLAKTEINLLAPASLALLVQTSMNLP